MDRGELLIVRIIRLMDRGELLIVRMVRLMDRVELLIIRMLRSQMTLMIFMQVCQVRIGRSLMSSYSSLIMELVVRLDQNIMERVIRIRLRKML